MDKAWLGEEPLMIFKSISLLPELLFMFYSWGLLQNGCPLACVRGILPAKGSRGYPIPSGNSVFSALWPIARSLWQPSCKFINGCGNPLGEQLVIKHLLESCQHPLAHFPVGCCCPAVGLAHIMATLWQIYMSAVTVIWSMVRGYGIGFTLALLLEDFVLKYLFVSLVTFGI
jgi:hypothetical protein